MLIYWLDVFVWFSHLKPVRVIGLGSRIHRKTGNIYDNFSMDFEFEGGVHVYGMVRRIDGCDNSRGAFIQGDKGSWNSDEMAIRDRSGNIVWQYDWEAAKVKYQTLDMYTLEHIDLINHIRKGTVIDIAEIGANSALAAVMARESAYTGKTVTWDQVLSSNLNMMPSELALGNMDISKYPVPLLGLPGKEE